MTPYYERDGITIFCDDCLEVMPQIELRFDAIICDLPYGTTDCSWDVIIPFAPLWENYKRLIKDGGAIVLFGNDPFSSNLVTSNINWFRHKWIWEKDRAANFLHAPYMPIANCEEIIIFNSQGYTISNKNKPIYNPQKVTSKRFKERTISRAVGGFSLSQIRGGKQTPLYSSEDYNGWERYPTMKLYFMVDRGKDRVHPTQKPVSLLAYLIRTYTNSGELILDNCMGSGTTLVAAQREGRRAVGIEISEAYCQTAVERLKQPSFFSISSEQRQIQPKAKQGELL